MEWLLGRGCFHRMNKVQVKLKFKCLRKMPAKRIEKLVRFKHNWVTETKMIIEAPLIEWLNGA